MPVVTLDKADLYEQLGKTYAKEEFDQLCFEFGIELEEDVRGAHISHLLC
jgi:phenylalanyl-tRNA synthetase beta chain